MGETVEAAKTANTVNTAHVSDAAKTAKKPTAFEKRCEHIMDIYLFIMLGIFPLYVRFPFVCDIARMFGVEWQGMYFDVLNAKFGFFWKVTLFFAVLLGTSKLVYFLRRKNKKKIIKGILNDLNWVDKCFALFIIVHFVSMIASGYPYETWWGSLGRNMGVFMWLMIYFSYLMIRYNYHYKRWHLNVFLISGCLVCLWGITDFLWMDIFGFFDGLEFEFKAKFASSIGNINSYTAMTGAVFALSAGLVTRDHKKLNFLLSLVVLAISGYASVAGISDNAVLSTGTAIAVIAFWGIEDKEQLKRAILVLAVFLTSLRLAGWTTMVTTTSAYDFNMGVLLKIGRSYLIGYLAVFIWIIYIVLMISSSKVDPWLEKNVKNIVRGFRALIITGIIVVILILIMANLGIASDLWEPYKGILVFNRSWGTGRGLAWYMSFKYFFKNMNILQKLIGYGPESFYMITMDNFFTEMSIAGYGMFDNAHSAYINYLMTVGILGVGAYIGMLWNAGKNLYANRNLKPIIFGMFVMLLAYSVQDIINFQVPFVIPVILMLYTMALTTSHEMTR